MGTKSRETIYGASIRAAAERAAEVRKDAWGPSQIARKLGIARASVYRALEAE